MPRLLLIGLMLLVLAADLTRAVAPADEIPILVVPRASGPTPAVGEDSPAPGLLFHSVLVGRFLDEEPARRLSGRLQDRGLTAFVVKRRLVVSRLLIDRDQVGEFYLTLVGLFGLPQEAERLGSRLAAEGLIKDYQVVGIEEPGEVASTATQTRRVDQEGDQTVRTARARAAAPLPPDSPAATGEAF